jgi:hypothetical protein
MSHQSMIRIHGQEFVGDSATCYKILELMQDVQPIDVVYDFDAEASVDRKLYHRTDLECTLTAVLDPALYLDRRHAEQARDDAIALRAQEEAA